MNWWTERVRSARHVGRTHSVGGDLDQMKRQRNRNCLSLLEQEPLLLLPLDKRTPGFQASRLWDLHSSFLELGLGG